MGKLFCLIGKSASGKDTIFKRLMNNKELNLSPVVTYTTRPRRENETEGVEYHFITEKQLIKFKNSGKIIELRRYETVRGIWYYCIINDGGINLCGRDYLTIDTLEGYVSLKSHFGEAAVPLYIEVEDGERLLRAVKRELGQKNPDYSELCRRFLADSKDFSEDKLRASGISLRFDNSDAVECTDKITRVILDSKGS